MATAMQSRLMQEPPTNGTAAVGKWHMLRALRDGNHGELHRMGVQKAILNENTGDIGGYIVPPDYSVQMLEAWSEEGFVQQRANVIPMASKSTFVPYVDSETVQAAGTSPFFGGLSFGWYGQGQNPPDTNPQFHQLNLNAGDLIGNVILSNQLLTDMGDAGEQKFMRLLGRAAAWYEEYAVLQGLGIDHSQPLGVLNAPSRMLVPRQIANQISGVDVANMLAKLIPFSWMHSIWAASPTALAQLGTIDGFTVNEDPMSTEQGWVGTLYGRPVRATEKLPALGTQGDLIYFDPSLYVIGRRQEIVITASETPNFNRNETMFRVWSRIAGLPMFSGPITLADGASTASPFVILQ